MKTPRTFRPARIRSARVRSVHALSALFLGLFVVAHMLNHAVGLFGEDRHIAFMQTIRQGYRTWAAEAIRIAVVAWQGTNHTPM